MNDESNIAEYVAKPVFRAEKIYEPTPVGVVMGPSLDNQWVVQHCS